MPLLILLRHGQSTWNLENKFTGNVDVELTWQGTQEAIRAGDLLKPYSINMAYTSVLKRAIQTLEIVLHEIDKTIPITQSPALNERNYGDLQGMDKRQMERRYGVAQVFLWRRSFDSAPPHGESLKDAFERVTTYYRNEIEPELRKNNSILVVAHGNSLRALMMYLENISPQEISEINIPTGVPRVYEYDAVFRLVEARYIKG